MIIFICSVLKTVHKGISFQVCKIMQRNKIPTNQPTTPHLPKKESLPVIQAFFNTKKCQKSELICNLCIVL